MKFKGDIIITDPCYIIRAEHHGTKPLTKDDWSACKYGSYMEVLGIKTYLTSGTEYGDWSCTTYKDNNTGEVLGHFCADAGLVSVFLLDEVLKYNPDFDYHLNNTHTTTWIKNFDGDVEITHRTVINSCDCGDKECPSEYEEVSVVGKGNINFYTSQTGL